MVHRAKRKIANMSIDSKLMLSFALLLFLMLAICLVATQISLNEYDKKLYKNTEKELEYFIQTIDDEISSIDDISYNTVLNYDTQRLLYETVMDNNVSTYNWQMRQIILRFIQELLGNEKIAGFIYIDPKNNEYANGDISIEIPEEKKTQILDLATKGQGQFVFIAPDEDFPYLISARMIRYYINADLTYLGTMILITDIKATIEPKLSTLESSNNSLVIMNDGAKVYSSSNLGEKISKESNGIKDGGYRIERIDGSRYFICLGKSGKTGWRYINAMPYDELFLMSQITRFSLIIGFIMLYIIAFFIVRKISKIITKPLKNLSSSMALVENGNFDSALDSIGDTFSDDEIGQLGKDYTIMLKHIKALIHDNYEKQILVNDAKYRALKAQINPHFLYNTLNSIGWMVQLERPKEARAMINALGEILHESFRPDRLVYVSDEIRLLEDYICIQRIRYSDRAIFMLTYDDGIESLLMPQMILQPLVENAIYHAVDESDKLCTIKVDIERIGEKLEITVSDNGPGMSKKRLDEVRSLSYSGGRNGIGIKNIYSRLELLYPDNDYSIKIDSSEGNGTTIVATLPIRGE